MPWVYEFKPNLGSGRSTRRFFLGHYDRLQAEKLFRNDLSNVGWVSMKTKRVDKNLKRRIIHEDMKVILLKQVKSLGQEGDVVEVSDGHARNFLFPQNLAVTATPEALRARKEREEKQKQAAHKELSRFGDLAAQLDGFELTIQQKMNDKGTFYAAVTEQQIVDELKKNKFKGIEPDMITVAHPIKEPGETPVKVSFPHGFEAEIRVVSEGK